jgi:hypothetical protein
MFGKSRGGLAVVLLAVPLVVLGAPGVAGATVTTCAPTGNVGVGEFPAAAGSVNSSLKVACTFVNGSGATETIHDFAGAASAGGSARWMNGSARTTSDFHITSGSAVIWSNTAMFQFCATITASCGWNDVNHVVTGPGIPTGAFIKATATQAGCTTPCTAATLSYNATATNAGTAKVIINNAPSRTLFHFVLTAGSPNFSDAGAPTDESTGNFRTTGLTNSDVGLTVTGPGVPVGAKIATVTGATTGTLSLAADTTEPPAGCTKTALATKCNITEIGSGNHAGTTRQVQDAGTNITGSTVTSNTAAFVASDAGIGISGPGIPVGSFIKAVTNATTVTTTKPITATATAQKVVIGSTNSTAPLNNEQVAKLDAEIALAPNFVGTPASCIAQQPVGFSINATILLPGSFDTAAGTFGSTPPTTGAEIAQIKFGNGTSPFVAFIVQVKTDAAHLFPHYDFVETFAPIGLADCKNGTAFDAVAEAITVNGTTISQQNATQGFGSPGTGGIRGLDALVGATTSSATTAKVETPTGTPIAGANPATCTVTKQAPNNPSFTCGLG